MELEPVLRNGEPRDAARLAALGMQVWLHTYATRGISETVARHVLAEFTPAKFDALMLSDTSHVLVAEQDDHLVGYAVLTFGAACPACDAPPTEPHAEPRIEPHTEPPTQPTTELATLYVQAHFARQGIGARLLDAAAALATVRSRAGLWLTVNARNDAAMAFYARHGYARVGTAYFTLGGVRHENHVLVAASSASAHHPTLPQTLGRDAIATLIPHSGAMCLLDRLLSWDAQRIACRATNHRAAGHPLRSRSGLLAPVAIEYAAQAMALHGALIGQAAGMPATPGYLASARGVRLHVLRLDDLPLAHNADDPDELHIEATRQAGDAQQILYTFSVSHQGRPVADGRAAVVLNTALAS